MLAIVCAWLCVTASGCAEFSELSDQEAQDVLRAAILSTRATQQLLSTVHIAAAVTATVNEAAALVTLQAAFGARMSAQIVVIDTTRCPCDTGECACDGTKAEQKTCAEHYDELLLTLERSCAKPAPVLNSKTGQGSLSLDFGPFCRGCTLGGERVGGRLVVAPQRSGDSWSIGFEMADWDKLSFLTFTMPPSAGGTGGGFNIEPQSLRVRSRGFSGAQFGFRGRFVAAYEPIGKLWLLTYESLDRVDRANVDRDTKLTHSQLTSDGGAPLRIVPNDPEKGLAGGYTVSGIEMWPADRPIAERWRIQMDAARFEPGSALPVSGSFTIDTTVKKGLLMVFDADATTQWAKLSAFGRVVNFALDRGTSAPAAGSSTN